MGVEEVGGALAMSTGALVGEVVWVDVEEVVCVLDVVVCVLLVVFEVLEWALVVGLELVVVGLEPAAAAPEA